MDDDDDYSLPVTGSENDHSSPDSEMGLDDDDYSLPVTGSKDDHSLPDSAMGLDDDDDYSLPVTGSKDDTYVPYATTRFKGYWLSKDPDEPDMSHYNTEPVPNFLIGNPRATLPKEINSCEQMCNILLETYNTSILDLFNKRLQNY